MGKMICLMGKSSTGKDTIYKKLLEARELELHTLVPYTTRPLRDGEMDGVEYHFTDEEGFLKLQSQGKVIEARSYDTYYGMWRYFTVDDGCINLVERNYLMIGTLEAFCKMRDVFGADQVIPLLVEVDDGERLQRALDRERAQDQPRYEEMCRRFLADSEDYSQEKMEQAKIERSFRNENLSHCLEEIKEYLLRVSSDKIR